MHVTEDRLPIPQMVFHNESLSLLNTVTEARLLLVGPDQTATYISIPWIPDNFNLLTETDRWIFWSMTDERNSAPSHYWGYGLFGTQNIFERYISTRLLRESEDV